mgnify:CR=1 FL=1
MSSIEYNLREIRNKIEMAARKSNRSSRDITLVVVTKTVKVEEIKKALDMGVTNIGENRIQEALEKYRALKDYNVKWHMIGHLQSNKAKYAAKFIELIHSLDRISLAKELNKRAAKLNRIMDVLIQVNIAKDENKFGLMPEEVEDFMLYVADEYENLKIKGLMTIVPYVEDPEEVRPYFRQMNRMFQKYKDYGFKDIEMKHLSMGMTNDFEVAVEEGANMVRIGSGIFGPRV